ncbi:HDOD domain-containing protein [Cryptosporangium arvum]|uniref:HDOD domain-containing protein n=1 Tax=Cryptosporangium arvum TaxID=80871 RepID=UPI0004AD338B|nr:HDOD domain-containing protein [Cryptosporangium arvum]
MTAVRVLFADDEPNALAALRRVLRTARPGWEPEFASTTADALARFPVDVLVCDATQPPLAGLLAAPGTHARLALSARTDRDTLLTVLADAHRFLVKPCPVEDLLAAVDQVAAARGTRSFLATARLPRPPTVYTDLIAAGPDSDAADLAAIVERDVATTTDVLKLVNSGLFCPPSHVESLEEAVVLLGVDTLQALALASGAYRTDSPLPPGFDLAALAARSMRTAARARRLASAEGLDRGASSAVFLAGVLGDIGLLAQVSARPAGWAALRDAPAGPRERAAVEVAAFGCTSTQASAYLLGLWGFPDAVLEPVVAQPAHPLASPAAHLLAYARGTPPADSEYLTTARRARWDAACADLT